MNVATIIADGETRAVVLDWITAVRRRYSNGADQVVLIPLMGEPIVVWSGYSPPAWDGDVEGRERRDAAADEQVRKWAGLLAAIPSPTFEIVSVA
jgi:hypothetical protein